MIKKNRKKNDKRGAHLDGKRKKFSKNYQPSPEAKSKGWRKYREKKAIKETFGEFSMMSLKELKEIYEDMKKNPDKWTVIQYKTVEYLLNNELLVDFMNRGLEYAKNNIDISGDHKLIIEHKEI